MKKLLMISFICFFVLGNLFAQDAKNWNLKKILDFSRTNSPLIKKEALKVEEAGEAVKELESNRRPQIEGAISGSTMFVDLNVDLPQEVVDDLSDQVKGILTALQDVDRIYSMSGGVTLSQLIYNPVLKNGIRSAKTAQELYGLGKNIKEEEMIYEISSNYYQVLLNMSQINVIDINLKSLEQLQVSTKLLYENDLGLKTDNSRIKVNITNLQTQRTRLLNGINSQLNYIKVLAGLPLKADITPDQQELDAIVKLSEVNQVGFDVNNRLEYQSLMKQKELLENQIAGEKAAYLPTVAAMGRAQWQAMNSEFKFPDWNGNHMVGVNVTVPIFDSGKKKHKVRQAKLKREQAEQDIIHNGKMLTVDYLNSINQLTTSWDALLVQETNKELAEEVYDQSELQYKEGVASLTDLLNAEVSFREAQNAYNQHVLDYKVALLNLMRSKGELKTFAE
jgi:outer membrane protein TolC